MQVFTTLVRDFKFDGTTICFLAASINVDDPLPIKR